MPISFPAPTQVNSSTLGGDQTNAMVAALSNGGYVVAWTTAINGQNDVMFQRYDALGTAQGGPVVANATLANNQSLFDIAVTPDNGFTLAWASNGAAVTRSFNVSGAATSGEVVTTIAGGQLMGMQVLATGTNQYKLFVNSNSANTVIEQATFDTTGAVVAAKSTITPSQVLPGGITLVEVIAGAAGEQLMAFNSGQVVSSNGVALNLTAPTADIVKLQDGGYVIAQGPTGNSEEALMTGLFGLGALNSGYAFSAQIAASAIDTDFSSTNRTTFDKTLVNLGDGRILMFWVADTGTTFFANNDGDGLFAAVYNTVTGQFDSSLNTQLRDVGQLLGSLPAELISLNIDAERLVDGRVVLTFSQKTGAGLTGFDIYSTIIDLRSSGVSFAASSAADSFVGTASFADTVSYAGLTGTAKVDLQNLSLNAGVAAGDVLTLIENVIGTSQGDELYGNGAVNSLSGGAGSDRLYGRDGNDQLAGEDGNDVLIGGLGDDTLLGGIQNDILFGGAGNDTGDGGSGDDKIAGADGNDTLLGGDDNDKVLGQGGDDHLDGGAGLDFLAGGDGNDTIFGGNDADSISGGAGDDVIDAGSGNDFIKGGTGFDIVDGGTGIDTISYAASIAVGFGGVIIDLDAGADAIGNVNGDSLEEDLLVNIENAIGSDGNDYIAGGSDANVLRGGGGNDVIFGRAGTDTMFGGAGADTFVFNAAQAQNDRIQDFAVGTDKLQFVSSAFGDLNAGNIAASFVANASATVAANANPQFVFDNGGGGAGRLFFDADGNGAGAAVLIATLTFASADGLATFGAADFTFL